MTGRRDAAAAHYVLPVYARSQPSPDLGHYSQIGTWFLRYVMSFLVHLDRGGRRQRLDRRDCRRSLPADHTFVGHTVCLGFSSMASGHSWWNRAFFHVPGYDYLHEGWDYANGRGHGARADGRVGNHRDPMATIRSAVSLCRAPPSTTICSGSPCRPTPSNSFPIRRWPDDIPRPSGSFRTRISCAIRYASPAPSLSSRRNATHPARARRRRPVGRAATLASNRGQSRPLARRKP